MLSFANTGRVDSQVLSLLSDLRSLFLSRWFFDSSPWHRQSLKVIIITRCSRAVLLTDYRATYVPPPSNHSGMRQISKDCIVSFSTEPNIHVALQRLC